MLGKSGGADQVLSLPKGGGALKGLGEKFSPDLYTGTGNFSVPLTVPPGRNGLQPQLALTYSTGNGNGPFGLGWSLSVPGVTLKTSKGLPRYQGKDVYVLSGAEDLVLVNKASGASLYSTFRTLFRPSEAILEGSPAETGGRVLYTLWHALQPIAATSVSP